MIEGPEETPGQYSAFTFHIERRWHREQRLGLRLEDLLGLPGHTRTGRPQYEQDYNSFQTLGQPSFISKPYL